MREFLPGIALDVQQSAVNNYRCREQAFGQSAGRIDTGNFGTLRQNLSSMPTGARLTGPTNRPGTVARRGPFGCARPPVPTSGIEILKGDKDRHHVAVR